ncbi:hypothetical protein [Kitasatospora sp. GP82]|uniref:hypothetical protein n=1 Tax=Kitasatospora sp. GP82 TaxID=3035089 RepID=UPI0024772DAA|nr:hypothetical protein [Kitasatospora sp. GP82]MDH6125030.1 hypothetical protein [Kitasatospora sp. GP82]
MSGQLFSRGVRAAAVAVLALTTTVGAAGTAAATSPEDHPIEVGVDASGIRAPDSHQGGLVSFRVKTADANGRQLQLLRPHDGVSLDRVLHDLADSISSTPSTAATGIRAVRGEAEALGGALVTPQIHEQFTEAISPGTVYLLDFTAFRADPAHPVVKSMQLVGTNGQSANQARFPGGIVIQQDTTEGPRFHTMDVVNAHLSYLVHNDSTEIRDMQLRPVASGTTDAQVQTYLDKAAAGGKPSSPFTGPATGLGAISPGRTALVQSHGLKPGSYVLLCSVPDEKRGLPHAFLGTHKVVELR